MSEQYFLQTGDTDRKRLTILSRLYNPNAIAFLQKNGVTSGMTVLEIGCGSGHMACDLARLVGNNGKVIALDNSPKQIEIAKQVAAEQNIHNIEFVVHDVLNLDALNLQVDATYGRWVVEFLPEPDIAIKNVFKAVKPGGLFAYEASNMKQTHYFSIPHTPIVAQWHTIGPSMFAEKNCPLYYAFDNIYPLLCELGCNTFDTAVNQATLTTPEDKSVYRLGCITSKPMILQSGIMTETEFDELIKQLKALENSNTITGFYHNILFASRKPNA